MMKLNILVARTKGLGAAHHKALQSVGLLGAMLGNAISPAAMRPFVERVLFHTSDALPYYLFSAFARTQSRARSR